MIWNKENYTLKYSVKKEYYTLYHVYKKGAKIGTFNENPRERIEFSNGYTIEKDFNEENYKKELLIHKKLSNDLWKKYKKDLYDAEGFDNYALNDLLYSRAYESRHSEGYEAVEEEFLELYSFACQLLSYRVIK